MSPSIKNPESFFLRFIRPDKTYEQEFEPVRKPKTPMPLTQKILSNDILRCKIILAKIPLICALNKILNRFNDLNIH